MLESLVSPEAFPLSSMDMSVLKWMQQQQVMSQGCNNSPELLQCHGSNNDELLQSTFTHFQTLGSCYGPNYNVNDAMDGCISRTSSCQMEPVDTMAVMLKNTEENRALSLKNKRKAREEHTIEKKIKVEAETESSVKEKINVSNTEASSEGNLEIKKLDYIHVRARRGQATDRHSLAERARREKISKKMKYLQDLVPGCNKVTGKAGMLDEIINYVQSLQRQVEFLSMKLAVLNPEIEFAMEDLSVKQFQAYLTNLPIVIASKPSITVDMPLFPLDQQGSLDFSVINQNQATSIEAPSASWETQTQSLYNTSCIGFQY